jgi:hypothetical protein
VVQIHSPRPLLFKPKLAIRENRYTRTVDPRAIANLEVGREPQGEAARGAYGVARKKASEVDDIQNVGEVLSIGLNLHS